VPKTPLMRQARAAAPPFKRPDIAPFIPKGQEDAVARLVAAGMKMMYAPGMKEDVLAAVQSPEPVGKKLGENAAGIVLALMQQAQGKVPEGAIFPAAAELMSECAEMLVAAGEPVTQEDWKEGFMVLIAVIGKQMGGTDEQIMAEVGRGLPGGPGQQRVGPDDEGMPAEPGPDDEEQMA